METAIKKAIEGGYNASWDIVCGAIVPDGKGGNHIGNLHPLLDPLFWQALGKNLGWNNTDTFADELKDGVGCVIVDGGGSMPVWLSFQHRFIDHIAEGKSIDEFFNQLWK